MALAQKQTPRSINREPRYKPTLIWSIYNTRGRNIWKEKDSFFKKIVFRGAWVAQWIEHPTSAQVMISQFVSSSPASGSVLTAQSLEPASDSVSPSLCPSPTHALSLCQK